MLSTDKPSSSYTACEGFTFNASSIKKKTLFLQFEARHSLSMNDNLYEEEVTYNLFCVITLRGVTDVAKRTR